MTKSSDCQTIERQFTVTAYANKDHPRAVKQRAALPRLAQQIESGMLGYRTMD